MRRRRLCLLFVLLTLPLFLRTQRPRIACSAEPQLHPEVAALLQKGVEAHRGRKFDESLRLYYEALTRALALSDRPGEARALPSTGWVYGDIGQPHKALEYLNRALPLSRAAEDKVGEAVILTTIGGMYHSIGQPQEALKFYDQALSLFRATGVKAG